MATRMSRAALALGCVGVALACSSVDGVPARPDITPEALERELDA